MPTPLVILDIPGLSPNMLKRADRLPTIKGLADAGMSCAVRPSFPALGPTVHASIFTGTTATDHGIVGNAIFDRNRYEVGYQEPFARQVAGSRLWQAAKKRKPDFTVAALFMHGLLFGDADFYVSPAPFKNERGEFVSDCFSKPRDLYTKLAKSLGPFDCKWLWGPTMSFQASQWIARAARSVFEEQAPNITFAYMPQLEASVQKYGVNSPQVLIDLGKIDALVMEFMDMVVKKSGILLIISDYGLTDVKEAILINNILRQTYFLEVREIGGKEYIDFGYSKAFAVVDHQIAHVFVNGNLTKPIKDLLVEVPGIEAVLDDLGKKDFKCAHPRAGDLIAVAARDRWFHHPWWTDEAKAPAFARRVDPVRKMGYDPLEMLQDARTKQLATDPLLIKASHGRAPRDLAEMGVFLCSRRSAEKPPDVLSAVEMGAYLLKLAGV
ncbi:MAG: alkaline phosphatase family protein [Planctomycetes bacterium]|nr:alkaline phosphatase family protein [Planctomycetota bacterium]